MNKSPGLLYLFYQINFPTSCVNSAGSNEQVEKQEGGLQLHTPDPQHIQPLFQDFISWIVAYDAWKSICVWLSLTGTTQDPKSKCIMTTDTVLLQKIPSHRWQYIVMSIQTLISCVSSYSRDNQHSQQCIKFTFNSNGTLCWASATSIYHLSRSLFNAKRIWNYVKLKNAIKSKQITLIKPPSQYTLPFCISNQDPDPCHPYQKSAKSVPFLQTRKRVSNKTAGLITYRQDLRELKKT